MIYRYLDSKEWQGFELIIEENWIENPECYQLANHWHHLRVVETLIQELIKKSHGKIKSQDQLYQMDIPDQTHIEKLIWKAYKAIANKLYPEEKAWPGNQSDSNLFWAIHDYSIQNPE
jgi:di/tripeptidase